MASNLDDYSLTPPKTAGGDDYVLPYEASDYHLSGLDQDTRRRWEDMAGEYYAVTGERLKMGSGYRSTEHQARLHAADPNSGMVAPAGNSTHEQGKAIDLNKGQIAKLEELGLIDKYFNRPLMGQTKSRIREPWHIEHPEARADPIFTTRKKGVMEQVGNLLGPNSAEAATGGPPPQAASLDDYSLTGPENGAAGGGPPAGTPVPLGDATSDTLAQFSGPAGEMVGKVLDLPFVPLRKGLELFHQAVIEPSQERTVQEWADALQGGVLEGPGAGAPEAFAALPSKEVFVPTMEMALAPAYLKMISRSIGLLGEVGKTAFRRHAPDIFFKYTAKGGLPVPLAPGEVEARLMAMSGPERAEMARKYPQFRDVMQEMTGAGERGPQAGTPAPPVPEGTVVPKKWQKEMDTFATEGAQVGKPVPPEEVWGEWGTRAKKSGEPVIYRSQGTAETQAKYINRPPKVKAPGEGKAGLQEARAVETEDGWTLQVRERAAPPEREFKTPEPVFEGEPPEWKGQPEPLDPHQDAIDQQNRIIERLDEKIGSLRTEKGKEKWELKKQEAKAEIARLEEAARGGAEKTTIEIRDKPVTSSAQKPVTDIEYSSGGDSIKGEYQGYIAAIDRKTRKVIGQITYSYWNGDSAVRMVEVAPEYQRQGIATKLLEKLQSESDAPIKPFGDFSTESGREVWDKFVSKREKSPDPLQAAKAFMDKYGTARGVGKPKGLLSRKDQMDRAAERGDLVALIRSKGGFNPQARIIKENFPLEEKRRIYLLSRKGAQGPDSLLAELKGDYPDLFGHYETDADLLRAIADGSIYKKINIDTMVEQEADYYARIREQARQEGLDAAALAQAEADVAREMAAERDAIQSEGSAGPYDYSWDFQEEPALALTGDKAKTSATEARLAELKDEYPEIDLEKAAVVLRALPGAENGQIANMAADPEMFKQVAKGNLSASEKSQLLKNSSDASLQKNLFVEGPQGGLFEGAPDPVISPDGTIKMHSGGPDTAEAAKGLESRMWEFLAHHKIMPWGGFLKGRMAQAVPEKFMRQGFKDWLSWGYFPAWVADKWPAFKRFYQADIKADDVMSNHRYEIYGKLKPYFRELAGTERRRVHDVALAMDRIKNPERRRAIEDEIQAQGPAYFQDKHGLSAREAGAAHGLWDAYRYVRVETLKGMKQDVVDLGMKYGLDEARAREFAEDVLEKDLRGDYFPLHYSIMEFLPGKEGLLYDTIKRQRENYDFWSRERALYMFPHTRWGPYWLHVFAKDNSTPLWAGAAESIGEYKKMAAKIKKEFAGQEVVFKESRKDKVPMELYNNVDMPGLAAIMELSRDQFEAEAWTKFIEAKQAFFAQKGWGAHKIHKSDIPGFETENDKRVISDYFEGWIGMAGKSHRVRGFTEAWTGFKELGGGDDPGLQKYTQGYVKYLLDHPREAGWVRRYLYHLYLGGSMGFRLLHGLHAVQTAWPEMSTISKQPGRVLSRAIKDRFQLTAFEQGWSKDPGFTAEELSALEQGRRKTALSTDYTAEMAARSNSPLYRALNDEPQGLAAKLKRGFDLIYYPTAADRFTRESIFLGAVRELRGKGDITPEVIDRAAEIVDNSMYRYARGERPPFGRKGGAVWMTFQTWSAKYFQQIFRYMRDGERKALGRLLAAAGMVGGLNALGLRDVIQAAYRNVYGRDAESDGKHYLQTVLGDRGGEALNRIMFRGLPAGLMGFDLSPRMAHHLPWTFLAKGVKGLLGDKEAAWQFAGAALGPVDSVGRSLRAVHENAPGRAVEAIAPTWMRNPMAAHRLYTRGPETVSGRPIVGQDFKQHKMSLGEAALKSAGVQPTRLSEEQGKFETSKKLDEAAQGKLRDWASRTVQAKRANDKEELRTVLREWNDYNRRMQAANRRADIISVKQFRAAVQIRERPVFPDKTARKTRLREGR